MNKNLFRLALCLVMFAGVMSAAQKTASVPAKQSKPDPCALLTSADIQAVQGDAVQDTKPSTQPPAGWSCRNASSAPPLPASL